jgi:hypothetical protein
VSGPVDSLSLRSRVISTTRLSNSRSSLGRAWSSCRRKHNHTRNTSPRTPDGPQSQLARPCNLGPAPLDCISDCSAPFAETSICLRRSQKYQCVDSLRLVGPALPSRRRCRQGQATRLPRQHQNTTHSVPHTGTGRHLSSMDHHEPAGAANRPGGSSQQTPSESPKAQLAD